MLPTNPQVSATSFPLSPISDLDSPLPDSELLRINQKLADISVSFGANVQSGQIVILRGETGHQPFLDAAKESCLRRGASEVLFHIIDPIERVHRLKTESVEELEKPNPKIQEMYARWYRAKGARIGCSSETDITLYYGIPSEKIAALNRARNREVDLYYSRVAPTDYLNWSVTAPPTFGWAKQIFPKLTPERAFAKLNRAIAHCMRLEHEDPVSAWKLHLSKLHERAQALTALRLSTLHFQGPDTDLKVGLHRDHLFLGGQKLSKFGIPFVANLPTEEVFTTPDTRLTEGTVRVTRPVVIDNTPISGIVLEFHEGKVISFSAKCGQDALKHIIDADEGSCRLGESALVDVESRIFQTNILFNETLFDENAACHIALGEGFPKCIVDGRGMDPNELKSRGVNTSQNGIHEDLMISDHSTNVDGITQEGKTVAIIRNGKFVI